MVILKKRGGGANPYHSAQIILRPGVKSGSASLKSSDHWAGRLAEGRFLSTPRRDKWPLFSKGLLAGYFIRSSGDWRKV